MSQKLVQISDMRYPEAGSRPSRYSTWDGTNWERTVGCYSHSVYEEGRMRFSRADKKPIRVLTHAVNAWEEAA